MEYDGEGVTAPDQRIEAARWLIPGRLVQRAAEPSYDTRNMLAREAIRQLEQQKTCPGSRNLSAVSVQDRSGLELAPVSSNRNGAVNPRGAV